MLNLLTSAQVRQADQFTIKNKSLSSAGLMEAAALAFVKEFCKFFHDKNETVTIYCGTGNNGGDGLAIARILHEKGYHVNVRIARFSANSSPDFNINLDRLRHTTVKISEHKNAENLLAENSDIIIDAFLGSGLNKPLSGDFKVLVRHLNSLHKKVVAVDIPTGFFAEGSIDKQAAVLKADLAIAFQRPKINFFFPESESAFTDFRVVDIGLDESFIQAQSSNWKLIEESDIRNLLKPRKKFSHKGIYGHALIVAGTKKTMGAALLCADACLHSGAGLITACIPAEGLTALNARSPEIMVTERHEKIDFEKYQAVAVGPGLGVDTNALELLQQVIEHTTLPIVLDADALNILAKNTGMLVNLPKHTVLTPHVKEFDRLFGEHTGWWERVETARKKAAELGIIIVLKNEYTFIVEEDGTVYINPTGNAAMATGGMGDVLTGMIAAFTAQGYRHVHAAIIACYIHGKAGDILKTKGGMFSIPPRYLIKKLPQVIDKIIAEKPHPFPSPKETGT